MATNVLNSKWLPLALLSLAFVSGCCCQAVPLPGENQCPTDARRLYLTCGEEAVRRCPCGPDREFYGLKPTCWRTWPEGWHCNQCEGSPYCGAGSCGEAVVETPSPEAPTVEEPASTEIDLSNPFRSNSGADELPLPPITPEVAPVPSAPPKSAPIQSEPVQPTPTAPSLLELVPAETAPAAKTPAAEKPAEQTPNAVVTPPQAPAIVPPAATVNPVPVTPLPTPPPAKPPVVKPPLTPPQQSAPNTSAPKQNSQSTPPAVAPKAAKDHADNSTPGQEQPVDPGVSDRVGQHLFNNLRM